MVQSGDEGFIVVGADGLPVFFPFGGLISKPFCGLSDAGYPSIVLTVTGDVSQTVNWCDKKWVLPFDSGIEKCGYATMYEVIRDNAGPTDYEYRHKWSFASGLTTSGSLNRGMMLQRYSQYTSAIGNSTAGNTVSLQLGTPVRAIRRWQSPLAATPVLTLSENNLTGISIGGIGIPSINDYLITSAMFGAHTVGGVTFTWSRGDGW